MAARVKPGHEKTEEKHRQRLSPEDWIRAALETLVEEGPEKIQVARLARKLGVTAPSFYWHFATRDQLRDQVLEWWIKQMLGGAVAAAQRSEANGGGIRALAAILGDRQLPRYDVSMRRWAERDPAVAAAVAKADALRIRFIADMLKAAGLGEKTAEIRARVLMWHARGSIGESDKLRANAFRELIRLIVHDAPRKTG